MTDTIETVEVSARGAERRLHNMDQKIRVEQHSVSGALWFGGWLFTIGYLHLAFWKAALALIVWPYYIGIALRGV
jgi:hypothetical protein